MAIKKIKISVTYEEEGTDIKHSISKTIQTDQPIGEITSYIDSFASEVVGQQKIL